MICNYYGQDNRDITFSYSLMLSFSRFFSPVDPIYMLNSVCVRNSLSGPH